MQKISQDQSQISIKPNQLQSTNTKKLSRKKTFICSLLFLIITISFIASTLYFYKQQLISTQTKSIQTQNKLQSQPQPQSKPQSKIIHNNSQPQHQRPFVPNYIWQGQLPEKHIKRLKNMHYPFRLIRNCDILLERMEQQLGQKFTDFIYKNVNEKTDVCKYVLLYYEGGLYLDMDTDLDYECMKKFLKDQTLFFQMNSKTKGIDLFTIYSSTPENQDLKRAISFQNTFRSFSPYHTKLFYTLPSDALNVSSSGCVKHYSEKSWK